MKSILQARGLQSVKVEGGSIKLGGEPRKRGTQISAVEIPYGMGTGRAEPAAQALRLGRERGAGGSHQMGRCV